MVYGNTPTNAFPPTGTTWSTVAEYISSFSFAYKDAAGNALTGFPLNAANRAAISTIIVTLQGFESGGVTTRDQLISVRTVINVRNSNL